ncbi:MAG: 6-carboxytetrahydropterin synthase QueD [Chloroflexi bacterium]|nr:6-carboxytetrahydropterin synthase QueD [Chloroflexota bacterium]
MYEITIEQHFDAAHYLRGYDGKCEALHGHRFQVFVTLQAAALNEIGISYDFTVLKKQVGEIVSRFDHSCLNDIPPFDAINPSSENIATTIYGELKSRFSDLPAKIVRIEVWETPQNRAAYIPD